MATKEQGQGNIWFGVAMFLMGLIAGVILTFASGGFPKGSTGTNTPPPTPPAPAAKAPVKDRMIAYAADIGLNEKEFESCIGETTYTAKVNQQMAEGQTAGVTGTPGNIVYDMKSKKGILVSGAQPLANFQAAIDAMLADPAKALAAPGVQLAGTVTHVDPAKDHVRGDADATVAVIEYSDYECPFCRRVHPTYTQLMEQYDGKIMWVYRHFPLNFHPEAMPLAIGAECANELGGNDAFWEFTDKVMSE